jgi:hypothetical protein
MVFGQLRWWCLYLDTLEGPTYEASQKPVQYSEDNEGLFPGSREMPSKNVDQSDYSAHYADAKPPNDPETNPQMNVTHRASYYLIIGRANEAHGL